MYTNQLKEICNGVHFFLQNFRLKICSFTKNMLLYKYFFKFLLRLVVICKGFFEILQNYAFQKT